MTLNRRDYYSAIPQLEAKLSNLSKYITVEEGKIQIKIEDLYGNVSTLTQTAEEITGRVEDAESNISSLSIRADGIEQSVTQKAKTWQSQPTPPYTYGDVWTDGSDIYICTYTRNSGSFSQSDWTLMSDYTDDTRADSAYSLANGEVATREMLVRAYGQGTLTAYKKTSGTNFGVLTNASGSVDIVKITWSNGSPSSMTTYASYGQEATIGLANAYHMVIASTGLTWYRNDTDSMLSLSYSGGITDFDATSFRFNAYSSFLVKVTNGNIGLTAQLQAYITAGSNYILTVGNNTIHYYYHSTGLQKFYVPSSGGFSMDVGNTTVMDTNGYHMRFPYAWSDTIGTKNLMINSNGGIGIGSSMRHMKKDITPVLSEDLDPHRLYDVEVVQFKYKPEYDDIGSFDEGKDQIGFIAEDVSKAYPICAFHDKDGTPRNWNERTMIPAMVKLIQEQHAEIEELKRRLS